MVLSAHSTPRIWKPIFVEAFKALSVPSQTKTGIRFCVTSHILWVFEAHRKATISCLENWTIFLLACAEPWLKLPLPLCQSGAKEQMPSDISLNGKISICWGRNERKDLASELISKTFGVMNQCCKMPSQQTWPNVTVSSQSFKTDSLAANEHFPEQGNVCLKILFSRPVKTISHWMCRMWQGKQRWTYIT